MNYKERAGINKKSFELFYNGGTIWCEHLDSMGNMETEVINKFKEDYKTISLPSVSSYMIINLDETIVSEQIAECIVNGIMEGTKRILKIAFVGVSKKEQKFFKKLEQEEGVIVSYWQDFEKAKEWILVY